MDTAKYIVVTENGTESAIIFPCWLNHADMAGGKKVVSAGRVRFFMNIEDEKKAYCFGSSIMRDENDKPIQSRPKEDAYLIERTILNWGRPETENGKSV